MNKLFYKSIPYFSIIFIYILVGEFMMYRIKENIPLSCTVKQQAQSKSEYYYNKTLFGNVLSTYKYKSLIERKPSIIILGQSIVFNFRDFFFHPYEKDFYNTGLMARNIYDFIYVNKLIKDQVIVKPKLMVVGIDLGLILKNNQLDNKEWIKNLEEDPVFNYKEHLRSIQDLYLKPEVREVPLKNLGDGKKGMEGNGYRKDGSFAFKWELDIFLNDSSHVEGPSKEELINKTNAYKLPMDVDVKKWNLLLNVLHEYRTQGIELILYFPPLSDEFYAFAKKDKVFLSFWTNYMALQNVLINKGYDVISFATPSELNLNDYYMNNANHPGDVLVAHQFLKYCKSKERKNKMIDKIDYYYLDSLLVNNNNPLSFMLDTLVNKTNN